jgi:hypothetical protein
VAPGQFSRKRRENCLIKVPGQAKAGRPPDIGWRKTSHAGKLVFEASGQALRFQKGGEALGLNF